jgi:hypothetical protein
MAHRPKADESHQVLKDMSDAHEEQPGEIPDGEHENENENEKSKSVKPANALGKKPLP